MTASIALAAPQVVKLVSAHRSDHELLSLEPLAERSYIFDSRGNLQGTLINSENENRVRVDLKDVPETVIGSVLAAEDARFNRATLGVYEMGSVFKIFTTAMALDDGIVDLNDGYDVRKPIKAARYVIRDYKPKNRWLSIPEIFIYSSNIFKSNFN